MLSEINFLATKSAIFSIGIEEPEIAGDKGLNLVHADLLSQFQGVINQF